MKTIKKPDTARTLAETPGTAEEGQFNMIAS
jgi:hypothetical protein